MEKEYLIQKWLNDELSDAEMIAFRKLKDYDAMMTILEDAKQFKVENHYNVDDFEVLKKRLNNNSSKVKHLSWLNPFLKIASIVVIALGIYFTMFYNTVTQVQTLANQQTTIELPDASKVTLNALSEIEFDKKNWDDHREIQLKGEAYFKVSKGKTFDVITSTGIVRVVGTQFNVKQRNNYFEVNCFEGIVKVTSNDISKILNPGDTYRMLNGKFSERKISISQPQWTKNMSRFESVPIKEVIAEMERQYGIKIKLENFTQNPLFTGAFVHNNLKDALISITEPLNMTYQIKTPNQVVINGQKN